MRVERSAGGVVVTLESTERWAEALAGAIPGMLARFSGAGTPVHRIRSIVGGQLFKQAPREHDR